MGLKYSSHHSRKLFWVWKLFIKYISLDEPAVEQLDDVQGEDEPLFQHIFQFIPDVWHGFLSAS